MTPSQLPDTATFAPSWAARRLLECLKARGIAETAGLVRKNLAECARQYLNRRFDRKFNVDTSGVVQLAELTCAGENKAYGVWYEPTPIRTLKCMFALLQGDLSTYTFIDFGSGKGRTMLYASNFGFRRIVGVEFARELHVIAERNIHSYRSKKQKCFDITSVCADATQFALPEEECVLYFFHPFKEEVMQRVLDNIEASYRRHPRTLIVLYYHPQLNTLMQSRSTFRKTAEQTMPFDLSGEPCIYRRKIEVYETFGQVTGKAQGA